MLDVLESLVHALRDGLDVVHCQVVETKGSTPQKAGARMLVLPDGRQLGTLGGGCVEAEVKQKAIRLLDRAEGEPELHTFILDHDYAWADGLICGGKMVILAEVLRREYALGYFDTLRQMATRGGFTELISLDASRSGSAVGNRLLVDDRTTVQYPTGTWPTTIAAPADVSSRPRPSVQNGVAYLPTLSRITLVIVGAGHVGQAVAELAAKAEFDVVVVDDRRQYANDERFPFAKQLIVGPLEEKLANLRTDANTYALIVTRGHGHDQEALYHLVTTPVAYLGLIGSRRKIRMIFEALREQGVPEIALARVSAPVGIDIGSESVPEIAISILAELIAARNLGKTPDSVSTAVTWR